MAPVDVSLWVVRLALGCWRNEWPLRLEGELLLGGCHQCLQFALGPRRVGATALELAGTGSVGNEDLRATGLVAILGGSRPLLGLHVEAAASRASLRARWVPQLYCGLPAGAEFRGLWRSTVGPAGLATLRVDYRAQLGEIIGSVQ
jgi:hypothetical protein